MLVDFLNQRRGYYVVHYQKSKKLIPEGVAEDGTGVSEIIDRYGNERKASSRERVQTKYQNEINISFLKHQFVQ